MNPKLSESENLAPITSQVSKPWIVREAQKILSLLDSQKVSFQRWNTLVKFTAWNGGHIDTCKFGGKNIFHEFFWDPKKPKGGMPFMFPNAGPLSDQQKESSWLNLPQHGFGRISQWQYNSESWEQILIFSETPDFPYSGEARLNIEIEEDGSVIFTQSVTNTGKRDLPLSSGLHPYFRIPWWNKDTVTWDFEGGEKVASEREIWKNWGTGKYEVPADWKIHFSIPEIGEITLELSADYKKFWVWSLPEKDFICVEPVMNHEAGIVTSPIFVAPWETNINFMKISLKW